MEGRPLEETELVERAKSGDHSAYEALVVAHQGIAFRAAYLILGNSADAADAAQDGFIKAFYALKGFRTGSPFRPWLLKIVTNEARNRHRSSGRRRALVERVAESRSWSGAAPSPEELALRTDEQRELMDALMRLKDKDRAVVGYRYVLELSENETAAALGVPKGTVKSRSARALARLRDEMTRERGVT